MSHAFRPLAAAGLAAALLVAVGPALADKPSTSSAASVKRMKEDIFFLAGPRCEGRGIETEGLNVAAKYIAAAFQEAGLKPGGHDNTYFQPFTMNGYPEVTGPGKLAFAGPDDKAIEPKAATEFRPAGFSGGGDVKAGLVFAGYGISEPKLNYDDYAGVDAAGKWVIVLRRTPRPDKLGDGRFDTTVPAGQESTHALLPVKVRAAIAKKAAGIILVSDRYTAKEAGEAFDADETKYRQFGGLPVIRLRREVASELLKAALGKSLAEMEDAIDKDLKPQSAELTGWTAGGTVNVVRKQYPVKNVIGVLEGSGPLADETVVIGAHYDHLGYGGFGSGGGRVAVGAVHYGADDNASGTTSVIELARRFGAMKGREGRRLVFMTFSGEEMGLYGSRHYCEHPAFPLESTVAMVNLDMVGRVQPGHADWLGLFPTDRVAVFGIGTAKALETMVLASDMKYGLKLIPITSGSGPSDHDSFYNKKVPVLFLFTGLHADYHKPADTPDKINLEGMRKVVDLTEHYVETLAAAKDRPQFTPTHPGWSDPFEKKAPGPRKETPRFSVKLGLTPDYTYEVGDGMRVSAVSKDGPAEKAGLKAGDVIVEFGGKKVTNAETYTAALAAQKAGQESELVYLRGGKKTTTKVTPVPLQ
jgi:hypothetical protein